MGEVPQCLAVASEQAPTSAKSANEASGSQRVLFLNRSGGKYHGADDNDSSSNAASLVNGNVHVPPYGGTDAAWSTVTACVADRFSRWNVHVTGDDPGDAPHLEAAVGGLPSLLGLAPNIGGIASVPSGGPLGEPRVDERAVVFVFAALPYYANTTALCEAISHELGHAMSLWHEPDCHEIMSYGACGTKRFTNFESSCGVGGGQECGVSNTQNALARLDWLLGRKDGRAPVNQYPFVKLLQPAPGATVSAGAEVALQARIWDDTGVASASVRWGGTPIQLAVSSPGMWSGTATPLAQGNVKVWAAASDEDGRTSRTRKRSIEIE